VFLFSAAIAIASCWITYQFTTTYDTKFHKTYFYYLFTFFGFGFYGIWAQIIMSTLLSYVDTDIETIKTVANFLPILGVPLLIISWIMLTKMGYYLVQVEPKKNLFRIHILILTSVSILIIGIFFILKKDHSLFKEYLVYMEIGVQILIEFIYLTFFTTIVLKHVKKYQKPYKNIITQFILLLIVGFLLRAVVLSLHELNIYVLAPLLLIYFLSNFFPVFYLKLKSDLIFTPVGAEHPNEEKKILLFSKYKITKREKEIIDKICQGKTNQQIADELFIGLQTVKDHTHRIYSKIGINSRLKLVQMINR
jgi:DNA-binding CsgD family transcriptional regulator